MRTVKAKFLGIQQAPPPREPFALFNLEEATPFHTKGSTVTRRTLNAEGYDVPHIEAAVADAVLRGYFIKPKQDFGRYGYRNQNGKIVKEGFVVIDNIGCNAMPGGCWFKTVEEAVHGIEVLLSTGGDADKFWEIMQPFEYTHVGQKADFENGEVTKGRFKAIIKNFKVSKLIVGGAK